MIVLTFLSLIGLTAPARPSEPDLGRKLIANAMPLTLHDALMNKVEGMSAHEQGIFNEDVSSLLAPYFPQGQAFEVTDKVVRDQGLGQLQPFRGRTGPEDGTMYVTRFSLMGQMFSSVFVVVDFGFKRAASGDLVLDHVKAFLRASNM